MFHHLRRNPFGLKGHLTRMLVVAYAFPEEILQPLLPQGLTVDTYKGYGFAAVALTQVKGMRPALLPAWMGMNPFLAGFRIFARFQVPNGPNLRGLYILKSISGTRWFCRAGNLLTHYRYELGTPTWEADAKTWRMEIASPKPELGVRIQVRVDELEPALPAESPFETWQEARRFAGPLPFTFDYEMQSHSMLVVDGVREHWNPRPVAVDSAEINFFKTEIFKGCTPRLANAFVLEDIPYEWRKGRLIALGERTAQEVCNG